MSVFFLFFLIIQDRGSTLITSQQCPADKRTVLGRKKSGNKRNRQIRRQKVTSRNPRVIHLCGWRRCKLHLNGTYLWLFYWHCASLLGPRDLQGTTCCVTQIHTHSFSLQVHVQQGAELQNTVQMSCTDNICMNGRIRCGMEITT